MAEIGDTIGLDYFEGLEPEVRQAVQFVRSDLRALAWTSARAGPAPVASTSCASG